MSAIGKMQIMHGDITQIEVDAIVNAANNSLLGGFGVDGAIHRVGGKEILEECMKMGHCATGEAVITTAGKLPARLLIHTVGPVWHDGNFKEPVLLAACYRNSLQLAVDNKCKRISFPNISTGAYGFPRREAAKIAVTSVKKFLEKNNQLEAVLFVCFTTENFELTKEAVASLKS